MARRFSDARLSNILNTNRTFGYRQVSPCYRNSDQSRTDPGRNQDSDDDGTTQEGADTRRYLLAVPARRRP